MTAKKIFLDFDGVLVDLHTPWLAHVNKEFGVNLKTQDVKTWTFVGDTYGEKANEFFKIKGIYEKGMVSPLSGARAFVKSLINMIGNHCVYVISYVQEGQFEEKRDYASRYFGINPENFISSKEKYLHTHEGLLIDDNPDFIFEHVSRNKRPGILFNYFDEYGWARTDMPCKLIDTCNTYGQVLNKVRSVYENSSGG